MTHVEAMKLLLWILTITGGAMLVLALGYLGWHSWKLHRLRKMDDLLDQMEESYREFQHREEVRE